MQYRYKPQGVCSTEIIIDIENDIIENLQVIGGCHGNLQGIASLVKGMRVDEVILKIKGIDCRGRGTSCPDQIANALEEYKMSKKVQLV